MLALEVWHFEKEVLNPVYSPQRQKTIAAVTLLTRQNEKSKSNLKVE
jgi:hypothetical protein